MRPFCAITVVLLTTCHSGGRGSSAYGPGGAGDVVHTDNGATDDGGDTDSGELTYIPWLLGVSGTAADDVWAVGFNGVVLHWDGITWKQTVDDPDVDLLEIWAASPTDLWVVERTGWAETEERRLLRGRPGAWVDVDVGAEPGQLVSAVWGSQPGEAFVVGRAGTMVDGYVAHFTAGEFTEQAYPRLEGPCRRPVDGAPSHTFWAARVLICR